MTLMHGPLRITILALLLLLVASRAPAALTLPFSTASMPPSWKAGPGSAIVPLIRFQLPSAAPKIVLFPDTTLDFGRVLVGRRRDSLVRVTLRDAAEALATFQITPQFSRFTIRSTVLQLDSAKSGVVDSIFYAPSERGVDSAMLEVLVGNTVVSSIRLRGTGIISRVGYDTSGHELSTLDFGARAPKGTRTIPVVVKNTGDLPLGSELMLLQPIPDVFSIDSVGRFNGASGPLKPGDSMLVHLAFHPGLRTGTFDGLLYVLTDSAAGSLRLSGRTQETHLITITPDTLELPASDTCRLVETTLFNAGTADVRIDSIVSPDGRFAVVSPEMPFKLPAGDRQQVTIRFCPDDTVVHRAALTVYGNFDNQGMGGRVLVIGRGTMTSLRLDAVTPAPWPRLLEAPDTARDSVTVVVTSASSARIGFAGTRLLHGDRGFELAGIPDAILPGERAIFPVRFIPAGRIDTLRDTLLISGTRGAAIVIPLAGRGLRGGIERVPSGDSVLFDTLQPGDADTARIVIVNPGNLPIILRSPDDLILTDAPGGAFSVEPWQSSAGAITLAPGGRDSLRVIFHPAARGTFSTRLDVSSVELWKGIPLRQRRLALFLRGSAVRAVAFPDAHPVLGGGTVSVGDTIALPFELDLSLDSLDGLTAMSAELELRARSLYPVDALSTFGPLRTSYRIDGAIGHVTISGSGLETLKGRRLFVLRVLPLSTAEPAERISVVSASLDGKALDTKGAGAMLTILGCAVGQGISFGRQTTLGGIVIREGATGTVVTYAAQAGIAPVASLIDLAGIERRRIELPVATGETQQGEISLAGLSPGFYLLELRAGGDRSTLPILFTR